MLIYIADDDQDICLIIEKQLLADGFSVKTFLDGQSLFDAFVKAPCDLIITDVMMPEVNGFELCQLIRAKSNVPIIIISANGEEEKRLRGYELGSDDYLTKPFSLKELSLKAGNMLKRVKSKTNENLITDSFSSKDCVLDSNQHCVYIDRKLMNVSEKEFNFLHLLMINKNNALSREIIIETIWGYEFVEDTRLLDHVVKRIRKKLIEMDAQFRIETVWGYGYKVSD